jgi:hypothetical protein
MPVPATMLKIHPFLLSFPILFLSSYIKEEWTSIPIKYEMVIKDRIRIKIINPDKSEG